MLPSDQHHTLSLPANMPNADSEAPDQPAHLHSLIRCAREAEESLSVDSAVADNTVDA